MPADSLNTASNMYCFLLRYEREIFTVLFKASCIRQHTSAYVSACICFLLRYEREMCTVLTFAVD